MKKSLLIIFAAILSVSAVACGKKTENGGDDIIPDIPDVSVIDTENSEDEEKPDEQEKPEYSESEIITVDLNGEYNAVLDENPDVKCIVIADGATTVPANTFNGCHALEKVVIPDGVTYIGSNAFYGCSSLSNITLPESVSVIDMFAFRGCSELKEFYIPSGIMTIGTQAFYSCGALERFVVNEENRFFSTDESGILFNNDKTELVLCPNGTTITDYTVPDSVTKISANAFYDCYTLKNVVIPETVTTVGAAAFRGCSGIESIEWGGVACTIDMLGNLKKSQ